MNEYAASKYTESDGTTVYLDNNVILRVSPGGSAEVTSDSETVNERYVDSYEEALNLCWDIALSTVGSNSGAADIYVSELSYESKSGNYYFCFDYLLGESPLNSVSFTPLFSASAKAGLKRRNCCSSPMYLVSKRWIYCQCSRRQPSHPAKTEMKSSWFTPNPAEE